jgi:tetratricopeptide (TPR) repeat protein
VNNVFDKSRIAVRQTRMLLVKAGLREEEADVFLDCLSKEFVAGSVQNEESRRAFVESYLANLGYEKHQRPTSLARMKEAIWAILLGAAGSALWDFLRAEFQSKAIDDAIEKPSQGTVQMPGQWQGELLIEWELKTHDPSFSSSEQCLRRALEIREQNYGRFDRRTAVSLDALGMCLDAQGKHREAAGYRATALKVSERISGPKHPDTAAALSNLGLCLTGRKQYSDGERFLRRGYDIMRRRYGTNHLWTAAALFNLYFNLRIQGRFLHVAVPAQLIAIERPLHDACQEMMRYKKLIVVLDAVKEVAESFQQIVHLLPQ